MFALDTAHTGRLSPEAIRTVLDTLESKGLTLCVLTLAMLFAEVLLKSLAEGNMENCLCYWNLVYVFMVLWMYLWCCVCVYGTVCVQVT